LQNADKAKIRSNVKQLKSGYNKNGGYCFFDGILSKVNKISKKINYTIYSLPIGYVIKKGKYTAHAKTVKKAIIDVEFKILSEKLKKNPINKDTENHN
jgi:hypothetical protein